MRNVLVTGGSRGLGLAIASRLAACGYRVVALARSETQALRAEMDRLAAPATGADRSGAQTGELRFRAFDLADLAAIGRLVSELRSEIGPIYGLVNNAGLGTAGLLSMMRDTDIEALVRLNTLSPLLLTKYVARAMMAERQGRIVNISSIVASSGYKGLSTYSATKASLEGFTRSLAREVGQLGITVNAVAPGFIDTAMTHAMDDKEREQIARRSALRRMAEPEDVAAAVEYFLGERARNITGVVLTVDAGNTA
ncbi:MAG TPA: SDR family NAD(P)-dependent oxidoreductase [Steroidobacteraceae bacterium]|nr:SDR family NAD(P)-dependent oxidoreductase [Steroidobacteraceae bacterium]